MIRFLVRTRVLILGLELPKASYWFRAWGSGFGVSGLGHLSGGRTSVLYWVGKYMNLYRSMVH